MITLPLSYLPQRGELRGATWEEVAPFYSAEDSIRRMERASIRVWMEKHRGYLKGRVLDFGAGTQPYKDLVDGEYVPHEKGESVAAGEFDAVICNQVIQYLESPGASLTQIAESLRPGGHLLLTYHGCWAEVEESDLWRFTKAGMSQLMGYVGLHVVHHELRAEVVIGNFRFPTGYGVVARKP